MKRARASLNQRIKRIAFLLILFLGPPNAHSQNVYKIPLYIHDKEIWVEVAKTPTERAKGLMGRKHLGQEGGMFFIFETEDYHSFWMKDTVIPLSLDSHTPPVPILYALEMKIGWFAAHGIQVGAVVRFSK
jgi:uncharacterized membrane protein (UPF0127 family)